MPRTPLPSPWRTRTSLLARATPHGDTKVQQVWPNAAKKKRRPMAGRRKPSEVRLGDSYAGFYVIHDERKSVEQVSFLIVVTGIGKTAEQATKAYDPHSRSADFVKSVKFLLRPLVPYTYLWCVHATLLSLRGRPRVRQEVRAPHQLSATSENIVDIRVSKQSIRNQKHLQEQTEISFYRKSCLRAITYQ